MGGRGQDGIAASRELRCCFGSKHDVVSKPVEALDQALGRTMLVQAVKVIATKINEGDAALEHVKDRNQDLVGDGHSRLLRAHPSFQAIKLVAQVGTFRLRGRDRGGDQRGLEESIALAGAAPLLLASAHMVGRANPRPRGEALGRPKDRHIDANLTDDGCRSQRVDTGDCRQKSLLGREWTHSNADRGFDFRQIPIDLRKPADVQAEQQTLVLSQMPVEGEGKLLNLTPKPTLGQSAISAGAA